MFKIAEEVTETVQLFIGLSLVEFHMNINKTSLFDRMDESLVREIMEVMDIQSEFFNRVLKAAVYLRFPMNFIHPDDISKVIESKGDEVEKFAKKQFTIELDKIFKEREDKYIQLLEFFQTPSFSRIKVQEKFLLILSHI